MGIAQAWPYALLILIGSIVLAYISLKWYDEPIRKWLRNRRSLSTDPSKPQD